MATRQRQERRRAREGGMKAEPVGRVEKEDTLLRGIGKEATRICLPLMKKAANTLKKK